jgi:hypothetical protein
MDTQAMLKLPAAVFGVRYRRSEGLGSDGTDEILNTHQPQRLLCVIAAATNLTRLCVNQLNDIAGRYQQLYHILRGCLAVFLSRKV